MEENERGFENIEISKRTPEIAIKELSYMGKKEFNLIQFYLNSAFNKALQI